MHSKGTAGQSGNGNSSGWAKRHGDKFGVVLGEQKRSHWWFQV